MKKLFAISLLLLMLFNLAGYRLLFNYANDFLDKQAETSFDNNQYDETETVTIKVPLNIPYQADQSAFQRTNGKVAVNGKVYRYIKRKIVNNEMILVCLVDNNTAKLNKSQTDFFKTTTGLLDTNGGKKSGTASIGFFKLLTVYNNSNALNYNFSLYSILKKGNLIPPYPKPITSFKEPPVQPPDIS